MKPIKKSTSIIGIILTAILGVTIGFLTNPAPAEAIDYNYGGGWGVVISPSCPGGKAPQCVQCSGATCVNACKKGYYCNTGVGSCFPVGTTCGGTSIVWEF